MTTVYLHWSAQQIFCKSFQKTFSISFKILILLLQNMFQRILHYADAAVLYLAHVVKTGPKLEHLLKDTVTVLWLCSSKLESSRTIWRKDKLDKLQAIR